MSWKKIEEKSYKNNHKSNNYEVCTAVSLCFPNILDVMILENINLSSDNNRATLLWSNDTDLDFCHLSVIYPVRGVHFNCTLIS
jgi:hypothetical protein